MLLTELKYQIFRNKGRSVLLTLIAALLAGCMAFYVGNIQANRTALNELGENMPVTVSLANADGSRIDGVRITAQQYDELTALDVRDIRASVSAAGAMDEGLREQEPFEAGDTTVSGINCMEACAVQEGLFTFAQGQDGSFFTGQEAVCAVDERFAGDYDIKLGDTLELPIYLYAGGLGYLPVDKSASLSVAAIYGAKTSAGNAVQVYVPAGWLRKTLEENGGKAFFYDSLSVTVRDPLRLNDFKQRLTGLGLQPVSDTPVGIDGNLFEASAVFVEDELFIKTAVKLQQNITAYERFLFPFFGLLMGLMALVIFLFLRGSRREMAIADSLGRSKGSIWLVYFCGSFFLDFLGAALVFFCTAVSGAMPFVTALLICGSFLLCAAVGTAIALFALLRFDAMELLTKVD